MSVIPKSEYRFLGPTGLRVSSISLGGWITYGEGKQVEDEKTLAIFDKAFKLGINYFDTAEAYGAGACEVSFGKVIKKLGWKRTDYVISTKLFWGGEGVNDRGLSRKHIIEGLDAALARLQHDYVDIVFAHRPDPYTPIEEVVRAFTQVINDGKAHYWGTSMWNAYEIEAAQHAATKYGLIAPVVEQPIYNLIDREFFEKELAPIFKTYNYGTTVFSPLATGLLTGKYATGIPKGSRYDADNLGKDGSLPGIFKQRFEEEEGKKNFIKINKFADIAKDLEVEPAQLALAFLLTNKNVSTLITGASRPEQLEANLKAYDVLPKLTPDVIAKIEEVFDNKPEPRPDFGRLG
ncbi:aldo-keto reductase superfamily protein [Sugiyamaella lignohabitans]|uniref:Aldo-keto reductase superfamily protein n=1 Tax=Sugiyamaella lignohabitans TaxID=796027 RepID=A0A167CZ33_9ASCO|nr:aldo-keto reductase superfamily protein [Sugiyamaella lignohabitans]ANB12280.1 aldo-keto reductase superfamily protein [Sugiyamaella lignohabitans]